jgi:hypothetical protein
MKSLSEKWLSPDHIRLHAGELTAQEMRTVLAVLKAVFSEVERENLPVAEVTHAVGAGPNDVGIRCRGGIIYPGTLLYTRL